MLISSQSAVKGQAIRMKTILAKNAKVRPADGGSSRGSNFTIFTVDGVEVVPKDLPWKEALENNRMVMELIEGEDVKCFAVPFFMINDFLYAKSTDLRDGCIRMEIRIFNDFGFVLELHECSHLEKDENDSIGRRWRQIKDKRYALCAGVTHSLIIFTDSKMCYRPTLLTPFQPLWKYPLRKDIEYSGKDIPEETLEYCLDHVLVPRSVDGTAPATKRTRAAVKVPAPKPALKPTLYEFLHSTGINFMDFSRVFKTVQRMGIPEENGGESREAALIYMDGELWDVVNESPNSTRGEETLRMNRRRHCYINHSTRRPPCPATKILVFS